MGHGVGGEVRVVRTMGGTVTLSRLTEHAEPVVRRDQDDVAVLLQPARVVDVGAARHERAAVYKHHHRHLGVVCRVRQLETDPDGRRLGI